MKKIILLFVIETILFIVGFIFGVNNGQIEAEKDNRQSLQFIHASLALTYYSNHKEILERIESNDHLSAFQISNKFAESNKEDVKNCLSSIECKNKIESLVFKQAPELLDK